MRGARVLRSSASKRELSRTMIYLLIVIVTLGCIGNEPSQAPSEEATKMAVLPKDMIKGFVLNSDDFPGGAWVPGPTNETEDSYEAKFFRMEFGFGEASTVVSRVHYYGSHEEAEKDFLDAQTELAKEVTLKSAGIGDESLAWERRNEAYILFVKKNVAVELYLKSQSEYDMRYLEVLAKKIEGRIR